jgi:hypothetical protein
LWSDNSKVDWLGPDRRTYGLVENGYMLGPGGLKPTVKHESGTVIVWGCFSAAGVGEIHKIKDIMDRAMYCNIVCQCVTPSFNLL